MVLQHIGDHKQAHCSNILCVSLLEVGRDVSIIIKRSVQIVRTFKSSDRSKTLNNS